jgi:hypothetical protein
MGYFETVADAQNWARVMSTKYPGVIATPVPAALVRELSSTIPTLRAAESSSGASAARNLTDTQVLDILETRRVSPAQGGAGEAGSARISLLRPEDTAIRQSLKEAVAKQAPVSFAVQLQWSEQPIDLGSVASNSIFRQYTLYVTQGDCDGCPGHYLRLGFFDDAISAKQVAYYVRSSFPSVAVVPVMQEERDRADEERIDLKTLADPFQQHLDQMLGTDKSGASAPGSAAAPPPAPLQPTKTSAAPTPRPAAQPKKDPASASAPRARTETLEQTLELLAATELWSDDSHTETGVRHLTVEVQKRTSR